MGNVICKDKSGLKSCFHGILVLMMLSYSLLINLNIILIIYCED